MEARDTAEEANGKLTVPLATDHKDEDGWEVRVSVLHRSEQPSAESISGGGRMQAGAGELKGV